MALVDPNTAIREFLQLDLDLVELVGSQIYAGRAEPPPGYKPDDNGPCVVFMVRGGQPDYDDALIKPSVQFKVYGKSEIEAYQTYLALYSAIHNKQGGAVLRGLCEVLGQSLEEPSTQWPYVLAFFTFLIRQEAYT